MLKIEIPVYNNLVMLDNLGLYTNGSGVMSEPRTSSRGGLVERMAARAGFAPTLDTELIRNSYVSMNPQALMISPGFSPTALLDTPDFIPNSLIHPSPTTGKLVFVPCGNNQDTSLPKNECDKKDEKEKILEAVNGSLFTFPNPVQGQAPGSVKAEEKHSLPLNEDGDQSNVIESDGYNWRKYGQKQVKRSECPRSYYKCTYPNCAAKKKVERSPEGHVTEITYNGSHNHPKPPVSRKLNLGEMPQGSSAPPGLERFNRAPHTTKYESGDFVGLSSDGNNDGAAIGSATLGDGKGGDSELKKRKPESHGFGIIGASRPVKEPRVVVQTTSDVELLDDGYRWRKYGQKVVKGNPNPRSYYKCTGEHCNVRKHVERASNDLTSVITTYEGKHNHDVPEPRNSGSSSQFNHPSPFQINSNAARHGHMPSLGSLGFPNRHYLSPGFGSRSSQHGLARVGLSGLAPNQGMLPCMGQDQSLNQAMVNEMRSGVPNAEVGLGPSSSVPSMPKKLA